jgi:glutathione S-transferase
MLTLYELSGKADLRFSPFCWRARLAIAHKGLPVEYVPVTFTDKDTIAFSGQTRVPVLVDGRKIVADSWKIASHLEDAYHDRPSLFGRDAGRSLTRFLDCWATQSVFPYLVRTVLCDVLDHLDQSDVAYVRTTRERDLGTTWEKLREERDKFVPDLRKSLTPARSILRQHEFLAGNEPRYADYSLFGLFQWARLISSYHLLDPTDPVEAWRCRMVAHTTRLIPDPPSIVHAPWRKSR